ncbi:hypothetical protein [Sedimentibacter sp. B4]|uniref:hypothetical protein n=1 Tax=Sedimentibacter sp. B4 TaxID=304766 RepID=UPI0002F233E4|nr:hypothetical protein [Sedimentibacter sp. B4]
MQAAIIKTTFDRKTGKRINEELIELVEIDEDEYYEPLVKMYANDFLEKWKAGEYRD